MKSIVDLLPVLRYVIYWFPFLRRNSDAWYEQFTQLYTKFYWSEPLHSDRRCISLDLREGKYKGLDDIDSAWLVGILLLASQDTTKVTLQYFCLAMVLHPEISKEAQKQLDRVVGSRPPRFEDQPKLPYIEAILQEVLRWRPPSPCSLMQSALIQNAHCSCTPQVLPMRPRRILLTESI